MNARLNALTLGLATVLVCGCVVPVAAMAELAIEPGSFAVTTSSDQAGAHADLTESFAFQQDAAGGVGGLVRNVEIVLPVGFAGYPPAVKTCAAFQLELEECPVDAQIGTIEAVLRYEPGVLDTIVYPVYNMVPSPGETAVFGFVVSGLLSADIVVSVGPDYRLHARVTNAVTAVELTRQSLTLWGVPADPSHDAERGSKFHCEQFTGSGKVCEHGDVATDENPVAFLVNPTQCTRGPVDSEPGGGIVGERGTVGIGSACRPVYGLRIVEVPADDLSRARTVPGYDADRL